MGEARKVTPSFALGPITRRFLRGSWAWLTLKPGSWPRRTARTVLLRAVRFVLTRPRLTRLARRPFEHFPLLKRFRRRALHVLLADSVAPAPDGFWTEREQLVYAGLKRALEKRA